MLIDNKACLELGLPECKNYQSQDKYIANCLLKHLKINTRICQYIGIGHLNSLLEPLKKIVEFEHSKNLVYCPRRKLIPPYPVIVIYMTPEQIQKHLSNKKPA
jgi:hypothetical protein